MEQVLLTAAEVATTMGTHKTTIMRRAEKESWTFIEERARGGKIKKYLLHGLPAEIQLLYNKGIATSMPGEERELDSHLRGDDEYLDDGPASLPINSVALTPRAADGSQTPAAPLPTVICPGLAPWQNEIAVARYDLVSEYIKVKDRARKLNAKGNGDARKSLERTAADFIAAYNIGITHPQLFKILGHVAPKTVEKWRGALTSSGFQIDKLAPRYGQHRRGQRIVTEPEMAAMLLHALDPNQKRISQVIRWAKKSIEKDGYFSPSSEATMRRALTDWRDQNYDRWVFCREGAKAMDDKVLPYLQRDSNILEVGDVLVADGHRLNIRIRYPFTGKDIRATILMFYDWRSRYPAGWYIMWQENIQCVHAALRRAILNLGKIPRMVMIDNGKAFKAKVFTGKLKDIDFEQAGIQGLYARLGIETCFAMPYNAKAKPVERFFGTFNELERLFPSYTGNSIQDKPAYLLRNERQHKKMHNPWVPDVKQADTIIRAWAYGEYAARPHRGLKGETPQSVWDAGKGSGIEVDRLRFLMMTVEIKTIHRNGVTICGINFWAEALYGYRKKVLVRYDILDLTEIYIYIEDDTEFICVATPVRSVHPVARWSDNLLDLEAVQEGLREKKRLEKKTTGGMRDYAESKKLPWGFPAEVVHEELPMSPAQIKEIEEQAAATKIIYLDEKREPEIAMWDGDRYEQLLEKRLRGGELTTDDMIMMSAFEKTANYRMLELYFRNFEERIAMEIAGE